MKLYQKLIVTYFYTGYFPVSGTVASFFTIPLLLVSFYIDSITNHFFFPVFTLFIFIISIPLSSIGEQEFKKKDPHEVVIDEVAGMFFTFLFIPVVFEIKYLLLLSAAGFILFRIFDIIKLPPIYQLQKLPGGWGIVLDDVLAGIFSNIILQVLVRKNIL